MHDNKGFDNNNPVHKQAALETANLLRKSVIDGYGKDYNKIAYNSSDYKMLENLERNTFKFSAAKNYAELKAFNKALKDGDKIRSFNDFKKDCETIDKVYNTSWLQTEYDTAISSAQNAARWTEFDKNAMLKYQTAGDDRVRDDHADLDKICQPKESDFWDTYYPPNGWNCRCEAIEISDGTETSLEGKSLPEIPSMFSTNLAKEGLIFPIKSDYLVGATKQVLSQDLNIQRGMIDNWAKYNLVGENVINSNTNFKIIFNRKGISEALNRPMDDIYFEKNTSIYKIKSILKDAEYIKSANDIKGNPMVAQYHYFKYKVNNKEVYAVIREMTNGDYLFYSIVDSLK